jgi:hypothetical protein
VALSEADALAVRLQLLLQKDVVKLSDGAVPD